MHAFVKGVNGDFAELAVVRGGEERVPMCLSHKIIAGNFFATTKSATHARRGMRGRLNNGNEQLPASSYCVAVVAAVARCVVYVAVLIIVVIIIIVVVISALPPVQSTPCALGARGAPNRSRWGDQTGGKPN